ncbi:uncharacterized protein TRAVEDRAFT_42357 [Trametes versicolor FP-101664 SS1]|uniref:uncharacterized protein n=1 Tax=Trametes versicolor (strain FP-101664) TaxID=717944 RepID=UPI000462163A|nr:uncharacterized protein TRAVEDRAFT_42357 [Trametes versicolor FP-101664 SS1]EIW64951.1 hypothetical protein TRAVEDRAFT_42357 [Trametes versicolor FP-101664 SS1]
MAALSGSFESDLETLKTGLGAFLVGAFITTLAVGMVIQQTLRYFRLYPKDPLYMKAWVNISLLLCVMRSLQDAYHSLAFAQIDLFQDSYYHLVTHYLDPLVFLKKAVWTSTIIPTLGPVNYVVSESFFARRVYMLGRYHRIIAIFAMTLIVASVGFFIPMTVQAATTTTAQAQSTFGGWQPTVGSALLVAGDLQLSGVLVYYLYKNRTGVRRTNSMVDILIAYTVSSGSLICALNIVSLILAVHDPHNALFVPASMVVQAAYTSSFLVALNTRQLARDAGNMDDTDIGGHMQHAGEKGPASPAKRDALAMTSLAFATGPLQTQLSEVVFHREDDSSASSDTKQDAGAEQGVHKRGTFGTATV